MQFLKNISITICNSYYFLRKSTMLKSCKRKKLSPAKQLSKKDECELTEEEALADNECSDDSDSDSWQILEEDSENELDKAIQENASRNKLTAYNVKTILHVRFLHILHRL